MNAMKAEKLDVTTELKIKNAARAVFYRKGFAATKTRDIAEEAGINLALLNYYFRSKEKLFNIIMVETLQAFFQSIALVVNDSHTTLETKIETIVDRYIELLIHEPEIPVFIMSELRTEPEQLLGQLKVKEMIRGAFIFKQLAEKREQLKLPPMNPLYFISNLLGLVLFPFIASPIIKHVGDMSQEDFNNMMLERKKMIPGWINAIIEQ